MSEYDKIFAALKHPIRRRILLLLEQRGEMSFTDIQNTVGIKDTGLLSYHLKELAPLIEQSERGRYNLSEIGQTSMTLFRKVERERQGSSVAARKEIEKLIGKIVFLFFIIGIALMAPLSVDVYLSVQTIYSSNFSAEQTISMFLLGFFGMIFGVILFTFYDRHYFSKSLKTNVVHSTIFAIGISLLSISSTYINNFFVEATLKDSGNVAWLFSVLRTVCFLGSTPIITYVAGGLLNRH